MQTVLLTLLGLNLLALPLSLFGQFKWMSRGSERREARMQTQIDNLNDRLMYLVGRAWESPPPRPSLGDEEEGEVEVDDGFIPY